MPMEGLDFSFKNIIFSKRGRTGRTDFKCYTKFYIVTNLIKREDIETTVACFLLLALLLIYQTFGLT